MSDVFERLSASDPLAGRALEFDDLEGLITRISATPRGSSTWRRFQLGVSGALAASTLLTLGAIAALQGAAPSLPILNFAVAGVVHANTYAPVAKTSSAGSAFKESTATATVSATRSAYRFLASRQLANTTTLAPAYALRAPSDPASEARRVAAVFGVSGGLHAPTPGSARARVVGAKATVTFALQGLWTWGYERSFPPSTGSVVATLRVANLTRRATRLVDDLGYGYQLGAPTITTGSSNTQQGYNTIHLRFSILVNATPTGLSSDFTFSTSGVLLSAHGPAFYLGSSYTYPLLTPVGGVAELNARRDSLSRRPTGTASSGAATTSQPADVRLNAASLTLGAYRLRDGALWLVPVYHFLGSLNGRTGTWSLLALDPRFTKNASAASPLSYPGIKY